MPLPIYTVYLSGPMKGLTPEEAMAWRTYVKVRLPEHIKCWDPFRGKELLVKKLNGEGKKLGDEYRDTPITKAKGITVRDHRDATKCDVILINVLGAKYISIGTVMEAAWSYAAGVPIVLVMEPGNPHWHAIFNEVAAYITDDLDEGIALVTALLTPQ